MYDQRSKVLIATVAVALFLSTVIFALTMLNDETIWDDQSRLFTYMAVFFAIFLTLNILLVFVALKASKKVRTKIGTKKCTSCSSFIAADARSCPNCRTVQPTADENMYLSPKENGAKEIRPKK